MKRSLGFTAVAAAVLLVAFGAAFGFAQARKSGRMSPGQKLALSCPNRLTNQNATADGETVYCHPKATATTSTTALSGGGGSGVTTSAPPGGGESGATTSAPLGVGGSGATTTAPSGGGGSGGGGSGATTNSGPGGTCTSPKYTTTVAEGTDPIYTTGPDPYWWVNNDAWGTNAGTQTLNVCDEQSWNATINQSDNGGAVESYPDTEYDIGGRDATPTTTIAQYHTITSTFAEQFPSSGGWDAGYDLWLNNWGTEIMIWNQWAGANGYWPAQATIALTLGGVPYHFYNNGGELMFFRDTQVASGAVDILAAFQWLAANGYVKSTAVPTQLEYGVEISDTSGSETFPVIGLTYNVN